MQFGAAVDHRKHLATVRSVLLLSVVLTVICSCNWSISVLIGSTGRVAVMCREQGVAGGIG
jgi:hypothetical protein